MSYHVHFPTFLLYVLFLFPVNFVRGVIQRNLPFSPCRLFKQAHVHAGIDFKKYDDIEVGLGSVDRFEN